MRERRSALLLCLGHVVEDAARALELLLRVLDALARLRDLLLDLVEELGVLGASAAAAWLHHPRIMTGFEGRWKSDLAQARNSRSLATRMGQAGS